MRLDKYDGLTSLETFMIQLKTCTDYNEWTEKEQLAQLKAALKGTAAQVLHTDDDTLTLDSLCRDLQSNFGTAGFETQYAMQLKTRKRKKGEVLRDYSQDIHRLIMLTYPKQKGSLRDQMEVESFINGLDDKELIFQVRNSEPSNLSEAYVKT